MIKIAIVGSRDFPRMDLVTSYVNALPLGEGIVIVSGGARGVDSVAAKAARLRGLGVQEFFADWDKLGKGAGYARNHDIVRTCDRLVAFWDGSSRGTKHSIDLCSEYDKPCEVIRSQADA